MGSLILLLLVLLVLIELARALYREVHRTSWSLLEALIAVNILGHAVALPVAWSWQASEGSFLSTSERVMQAVACGSGGLIVAAFMAGGAIWVFRRLKAKGEKRTGTRLVYMLLGLFLFPSMVWFPFVGLTVGWYAFASAFLFPLDLTMQQLIFGWLVWAALNSLIVLLIWIPLYLLHIATERILRIPEALRILRKQGPVRPTSAAAPSPQENREAENNAQRET